MLNKTVQSNKDFITTINSNKENLKTMTSMKSSKNK
jgi:hypothetical protein